MDNGVIYETREANKIIRIEMQRVCVWESWDGVESKNRHEELQDNEDNKDNEEELNFSGEE